MVAALFVTAICILFAKDYKPVCTDNNTKDENVDTQTLKGKAPEVMMMPLSVVVKEAVPPKSSEIKKASEERRLKKKTPKSSANKNVHAGGNKEKSAEPYC